MSRLIVFGCSFVYGQGLPDCFQPPIMFGPEPSKMGWPNMLAESLGYECLNKAVPGAGNFEILTKLLDTDIKPSDLIIIGYSYFQRFDRYRMTDKLGNGRIIAYNSLEYKNMVVRLFGSDHYQEKNYWDNWLAIQHAELYLKSKNAKYLCFQNVTKSDAQPIPTKLISLDNFWVEGCLVKKDFGLDGQHPGIESNKSQFQTIYQKLIG